MAECNDCPVLPQVAQLEEQVAALSVQALAAETAPSGYAKSKYSVEEMDALLDKVAAKG